MENETSSFSCIYLHTYTNLIFVHLSDIAEKRPLILVQLLWYRCLITWNSSPALISRSNSCTMFINGILIIMSGLSVLDIIVSRMSWSKSLNIIGRVTLVARLIRSFCIETAEDSTDWCTLMQNFNDRLSVCVWLDVAWTFFRSQSQHLMAMIQRIKLDPYVQWPHGQDTDTQPHKYICTIHKYIHVWTLNEDSNLLQYKFNLNATT